MSDSPEANTTAFLVKEPPVTSLTESLAESQDQSKQELSKGNIIEDNLEKQVAELKRENRHLNARIRGYQTLGQLLEEAKRELKQHKQRNTDLQQKLDSLTVTEDSEHKNDTESSQRISEQEQNEMDHHQSTTPTGITDSSCSTAIDTAAQHSCMGPNDDLHEANASVSNNAHIVTPTESEMAESKQRFMSDSKDSPKAEIDLSSTTRLSLQSNPNTQDLESLSASHTQKKENTDFSVANVKDSSGFSGPSFVILPVKPSDEPSSTVSLWSMPDSNGQFSLPSSLSSIDASGLYSGEFTKSQDEESIGDPNEMAQQVRSISVALNDICNLSNQSTLAEKLAHLAAEALKVEKQLRVKKTMSESLVADYEKLRKQANLILPEYEKQITQLKLENEQLLRRVRQLEHDRDQLDVPRSQSREREHKSGDWVQVEKTTITTDGGVVHNQEKQNSPCTSDKTQVEKELQSEIETLREKVIQLTEVNAKWDEHSKQLQAAHIKEMTELKGKFFESQALLEKEALEAIKELKKRIRSAEEEKIAAISNEVKRRDRAEAEVSVVNSARKDLENQIQGLKDQVEFYRQNPPLSSLQDMEGPTDSITALNLQDLRSQFRLQRQQISIYHDDFHTERHDREKLIGEIDSLKAQISRLKKELKDSQEQVRQIMRARQMDIERTINVPPHHNLTYTVNPRDVYHGPQVAAGWQWQQVARKWRCARCTYDNEPVRRTCELCGAVKSSGAIYGPAVPGSAAAARESMGTIEMDDPLTSEQLIHRHVMEECDSTNQPSTNLLSPRDENVLE